MQAKDIATKEFITINQDETVAKLLGKLKKARQNIAFVVDNKGNYVGASYRRLLIKSKLDPTKTKVKKVTVKTPKLNGNELLERVAFLMFNSMLYTLPILKDKKIIAIVKAINVVEKLKEKLNIPFSRDDFELYFVKNTDDIGEALKIFKQKKIDSLPVVDEDNKIIGSVTLNDILFRYFYLLDLKKPRGMKTQAVKGIYEDKFHIGKASIATIMEHKITLARPLTTLARIFEIMQEENTTSITIAENNEPIAIVNLIDLLKFIY